MLPEADTNAANRLALMLEGSIQVSCSYHWLSLASPHSLLQVPEMHCDDLSIDRQG